MKAVWIERPGSADMLTFKEVPRPTCGPDEILIRVEAAGINRADLLQREGKYPPPPGASPVLGLEVAGVVESLGANVTKWRVGDRVMALLSGGGYARYAAVHQDLVMPVPDGMSPEQAAAIPEAFLTAWQCLFWIGRLSRGETVLIHAGASGVGSAAIQLANKAGAVPVVTAGSDEKLEFCRKLGAKAAVNRREDAWEERVLEATGGRGVDVVLDFVGAPYVEKHLKLLGSDGRWVLISLLGGSRPERFPLAPLLAKRIQLTATTLRARSLDYRSRLVADFIDGALPGFKAGELRPVIDSVFPWEDVRDAHLRMEANLNMGKIVLSVR
nr:NAD(P)H-quinone oxidoreductase [Staphylospora marina]